MKKYFLISGFNLNDCNRGTAALGYGSISFLEEYGYLSKEQTLINYCIYKNPFKLKNRCVTKETIDIAGYSWLHLNIPVFFIEMWLINKLGIVFPFTYFGKTIRQVDTIAAINGGDGFADIYGDCIFENRLHDIKLAIKFRIPLIILPQTIGPFKKDKNRKTAMHILTYAKKIYVRDNKYQNELIEAGLDFELTKDLSYYMKPQSWDINVVPNSIGLNISGLAYDNCFPGLEGQFNAYPELINSIIQEFQRLGKTIYLIPHSYNFFNPELYNDDMVACRAAYKVLKNKENVILLDNNLISPQVKYVISQLAFFIGTRMHANFAAIYSNVPLFGLAYSYKFQGAFESHGIYDRTIMINNISKDEIGKIVSKIISSYMADVNPKD